MRPPRFTRTDTLVPYTSLCRSGPGTDIATTASPLVPRAVRAICVARSASGQDVGESTPRRSVSFGNDPVSGPRHSAVRRSSAPAPPRRAGCRTPPPVPPSRRSGPRAGAATSGLRRGGAFADREEQRHLLGYLNWIYQHAGGIEDRLRSEERRVGKEWGSTC